jgi:CBS-domain-containing membrane protein
MSAREFVRKHLEEVIIRTRIADSTHNINAAIDEIDEILVHLNQQLEALYITKGALMERRRTILNVDKVLAHDVQTTPDSTQTTNAIKNLHRVNAQEDAHYRQHGC